MKNILLKECPLIQERYWGVNLAVACLIISVTAGISYINDGIIDDALNSFSTAFILLLGVGAYSLRKKRFFKKSIKNSKVFEWTMLSPLILYFLWYLVVHSHHWWEDPNPLIILSTVWSLFAYICLSVLCRKSIYEENK